MPGHPAGFTCAHRTPNRCYGWRSNRKRKRARMRCLTPCGSWLWRRLGKDKGGFPRTHQLQLFPDFHLLLAMTLLQPLDALPALLVLVRERNVALLQLADLTAL